MKKASMLLSIFALLCLLLAAPAAYADQEPPVIDPPSETDVPPLAEDGETEPEDIPADLPGGAPGGTVYAVSGAALPGQEADAAGQALTVVDYQLASGGESGAVYAGQSIYYYGADIAGVTYGVQIDGAGCGYFGSSDGAIPLYDGKGAVAGIVWGDRRQSTIDCDVGFLVQGDVTGGFTVEDGTAVNAKQELILCQSGSSSFRFNNARLHTDSGVLVRMAPDAGALTLSYKNGAYAGAHINESASPLTVRVEQGTLLYGDTSAEGGPVCVTVGAGGIWAVQQSASLTQLTVEEGGTVYGALEQNEDGSLTLLPSDSVLEPGVYEAQPVTEDLPFGPGPAVAEQEADESAQEIEAESEQEPATEADAYPEPEATPEPEEEVESAPEQEPATEADAYPEPEPTPEPKPENESEAEPETEPADEPEPAVEPGSEPAESADPLHLRAELEHSVLYSFGLSRQSILGGLGSARHSASSIGLTAQLAARAGRGPVVAALIKTGAKTHSFLPETLDKPSRILYNPYCCLAA